MHQKRSLLPPRGKAVPNKDRHPNMSPMEESAFPLAITFTGERRHNHFRVQVRRQTVNLTASSLNILIDLVLAREDSETGFVQLPALDIFRLRRALDSALGPGAGKDLIETGGGEEYCLNIPRDELGSQVAVTACFFELVDLNVVSTLQGNKLKRLCGLVKSSGNRSAIGKKSGRN